NEPALECGGAAWLNEANGLVAGLDPFSDELEDVRMAMMGDAEMLAFDPEGRVTLPRELMDFTGISGKARFVGMQTYFMIWQPERYA
ncbi:MAG TPA: division/cell wall cluster transcriptional repressor MraZ, partial [Alphaproteobacteria bacterium]|nr:division/cell wall cluster transcriptional repressor MraZ [Alphaproteobacteria bacterium]